VENDTLRSTCHLAVDFAAAIQRTGMNDQTIRFQKLRALFRQAEEPSVLIDSVKICLALAFVLKPQEIHDIGIWKYIVDLVRNFDIEFFELARHQRARSDQRDARAQ